MILTAEAQRHKDFLILRGLILRLCASVSLWLKGRTSIDHQGRVFIVTSHSKIRGIYVVH